MAVHGNTRFGEEHRVKARRLFVEEGATADQVAKVIGASSRTIQGWIRDLGWREARTAWMEVHGISLEELEDRALRKLLGRLENEAATLEAGELLSLLTNVNRFKALIAKQQGFRLVDAALVVGEDFQGFVLREFPNEAPRLLEAWKAFLDDVSRRTA
jgi:transposase